MPIDITERYKLIFEEHHYASDLRVRIFQGWCVIYAAFAAAFVWVHSASKPLSWIITAAATAVTLLMWIADRRNRSGIHASKDIGVEIERDSSAGIPAEQRFFHRLAPKNRLERWLTHSRAIDTFSIAMFVLLFAATWYLWSHRGSLP